LRHGEAVSIGIVAATRLAVRKEIARQELSMEIQHVLNGLGLPTEIPPDLDPSLVEAAIGLDKKRSGGKVRFVLPVRIGEVRAGVEIEDIQQVFES
jgi:3-dehydroquinate synthetase